MNNTIQILATEIAGTYKGRRGARHAGWYALRDHALLEHPEKLAAITVGQINSGKKVASTACRIGDAVANAAYRQMIWREEFDVGLFLLSVAIDSGLYEIRRDDKQGSAPDQKIAPWSTEPYRIYATGAPNLESLGYMQDEPFPEWTDNIDQENRRLLSSNCYTPDVTPHSTWVHAVNRLESVGYKINQTMLDIVRQVGLKSTGTKREQQEEVIKTATGLGKFYHRAHVDERGRIYINRSTINYQQGDMSRGLLEFADSVPLTSEGVDAIYLHIANCHGEKGDIKQRIQFAKGKHGRWIEFASNPLATSSEWLDTSDPWQLIRACIELKSVKVGELSHLIVSIDQSCSGLAWQAIMMNDVDLAKMTNLRGGFNDLYTLIGESINLPADPSERRQIIKRIVMPKSYGGGPETLGRDLRDWAILNPDKSPYLNTLDTKLYVYAKGKDGEKNRVVYKTNKTGGPIERHKKLRRYVSKDFHDIAKRAIDTLGTVAPATVDYAKAVKRFYKSRLESLPYVQWLSPSGFYCRVRKEKTDKVTGYLRPSSGRVKIVAYPLNGELNTDKMIASSLANVIHSLDASLVHMVLANSDHQIVCVHDSFGCHASNTFRMQKQLMSTLLEIDKMDVSLAIEGQDHGEDVTWHDLQSVRKMNDWVIATQFPKRVGTPPDTAFSYEQNRLPVVDATATNVFS